MRQVGVLILFFISCVGDNQIKTIDAIFSSLAETNELSGNVLLYEKGEILYEKSFGYSDYDTKKKFNSSSMFNIASVSKTFTATAAMMLEEQGLLDLDENIKKYFPELPYENITVRNLMTHTSGLQRVQSQPFRREIEKKGYDNKQIISLFIKKSLPLYYESGTDYSYSNTNLIFLTLIVEKVSKIDFNQFLTQNILEKADMQATFLHERNVPPHLKKNIVNYYRRPLWLSKDFKNIDSLQVNIDEYETFKNSYGHSYIYTTARDLIKFHQALQNGVLLQKGSLDKMYTPFKLQDNKTYTINKNSNYEAYTGLVWRVAKDSSKSKTVFHAGGFQGGRSFFLRNIMEDQCLVMLTNNIETDRNNFTFAMKILNDEPYELDKKSLARAISNMYLEKGIDSAIAVYDRYDNDERFKPLITWDFEEIGAELLEKGDVNAALKIHRLYTQKYPDEYSWEILGTNYLMLKDSLEAKKCFKNALEINPEYKSAAIELSKLES